MIVSRLLLAVACALALAAPARAELRHVKMTVTARTATAAPYFIAIDKGYFKDQGLDVEIVDAGGGVAIPATDKIYDYGPLREVEAELAASGWKPAP